VVPEAAALAEAAVVVEEEAAGVVVLAAAEAGGAADRIAISSSATGSIGDAAISSREMLTIRSAIRL
jgi:hypothetical protein